VNIAMTRGME
jgi:putative transposase